jgi:hypothetical protein
VHVVAGEAVLPDAVHEHQDVAAAAIDDAAQVNRAVGGQPEALLVRERDAGAARQRVLERGWRHLRDLLGGDHRGMAGEAVRVECHAGDAAG